MSLAFVASNVVLQQIGRVVSVPRIPIQIAAVEVLAATEIVIEENVDFIVTVV